MGDTKLVRMMRERLLQNRAQSEGLPGPPREQGPGERFLRGAVGGATAPLEFINLDVDPGFGQEGPGVAGTVGSVAGSLVPFIALEGALASVPLLAGAGTLARTVRTGTAFGAIGAGREPLPGETRVGEFGREFVVGGIFGAGLRPGISLTRGAAVGVGAGLSPLALGGHPLAPVEITGNEIADSAIFNATLGAVIARLTKRVSSQEPIIPDTISTRPVDPTVPTITPVVEPRASGAIKTKKPTANVTDRARRLVENPPFGRMTPSQLKAELEVRSRTVPPEDVQPIQPGPSGQQEFLGAPNVSREFTPVQPGRAPSRAKTLNRGRLESLRDEAVRQDTLVGREPTQPGVYVDMGSGFGTQIKASYIGLDLQSLVPKGLSSEIGSTIRRPGISHNLNQTLPFEGRSVDAFNMTDAIGALNKGREASIVIEMHQALRQGGLVTLTDDAISVGRMAKAMKERGFEMLERTTVGGRVSMTYRKPIHQVDLPKAEVEQTALKKPALIETRTPVEDAALVEEIAKRDPIVSTKRGRLIELNAESATAVRELHVQQPIPGFDGANKINTAGLKSSELSALRDFVTFNGDKAAGARLGQVVGGLKGGIGRKLPPGVEVKAKREVAMIYDQGVLDSAVDAAETSTLAGQEISSQVKSLLSRTKRTYNEGTVRQGATGSTYGYADFIRQAKANNMVPRAIVDGKMDLVMPDKSVKSMTLSEFQAFIEPMMPEVTVVPRYNGPKKPPIEEPIANVPPVHVQIELPFGRKPRHFKSPPKIPEAAPDVVLKADRSEVIQSDTPTISEKTFDILPPKARLEYVKGEAKAKTADVVAGPNDTWIVHDFANDSKSVHKSLKGANRKVAQLNNNVGSTMTSDQLRSTFRRRFAASNSAVERGRIKDKYRKYEAFFPRPGEPLLPGETPLKSLTGVLNPKRPPIIDLTPAGVPPNVGLPPGMSPTVPPAGSGPPGMEFAGDLNRVKRLGMEGNFRMFHAWARSVEESTQIPMFSKIFTDLFEGKQLARRAMDPLLDKMQRAWSLSEKTNASSVRINRLMEAKDKGAAIRELGATGKEIRAAQILREVYDDAFKTFNFVDVDGNLIKGVDYLENYVPHRRAFGEQRRVATTKSLGRKSMPGKKYYDFYAEHPRGMESFAFREENAFSLAMDHVYRGAKHEFVADAHRSAKQFMVDLPKRYGNVPELERIRSQANHFIDRIWGTTDESMLAAKAAVEGIMGSLGMRMGDQMSGDLVGLLLQLNVGAHIAWRVPLIIRNTWQVMLAYPLLGERAFLHGLRRSMTKRGWQEAKADGVLSAENIPFGDEIFNPFNPISRVVKSGTRPYSSVDDWTRVVAHLGTKFKFEQAALKHLRRGTENISAFAKESEIFSMFHPVEANMAINAVKAGRISEAAKMAGNFMHRNTNFIYEGANAPGMFRGVHGRLLGQFGTWPMSYIEYIGYLGKFGTSTERAGKWARFLGMNTAIGLTGTAIGVDFWKWIMFGPTVFTFGPMFDIGKDLLDVAEGAATGRSDSLEATLARESLKRDALIIPGKGLVRDITQTADEFQRRGVRAGVTRALTGQSPDIPIDIRAPNGPSPQRRLGQPDASQALLDSLRRK